MNWTLQVILISTISNVLAISIKRSKSEKLQDDIITDDLEASTADFKRTSPRRSQINKETVINTQQNANNKSSRRGNKIVSRHRQQLRTPQTEQNIRSSNTEFFNGLVEEFEFLQSRGQEKRSEHKYLKSFTTENYPQISLHTHVDTEDSVTSVKKINQNNRGSSPHLKGALTTRKNVKHNPTQKNESVKGTINKELPKKVSIIETDEDQDFFGTFPINQDIIKNENLKENLESKTIFPKQLAVPDVLDLVQNEAILGFPKGRSIENKTETEPVGDVKNNSVRNHQISSNEEFTRNITTHPNISQIEYTSQSNFMKQDESFKNNDQLEEHSKNIFEVRQTIKQPLPLRSVNKVLKPIADPTSTDEHYEVIANIPNKGIKTNRNNGLRKTLVQNEEDELLIQNAKYAFSSSQNDGISDLLHNRMEIREGEKVTGSYSYRDGFFLIKVNYIADKDGYRILSEQKVPLPGNGPQTNPNGIADIRTNIDGHLVHYVVHGEEIVSQQQRFRSSPNKV